MRSRILPLSIVLSFVIIFSSIAFSGESKYFLPFDIKYHTLSKPTQKQVDCLAENIYHEAKSESHDGKVAVAMVTLNRVVSGNYADDICGVVKQKANGTCQFSWVCVSPQGLTIRNYSLYNDIRNLAVNVVMNYENMADITHGATFYHATYVNPGWRLPKTTQIGNHIFYKSSKDIVINKELKI
jgi:spore germination cell wall hydrolase CwlJ-like protein